MQAIHNIGALVLRAAEKWGDKVGLIIDEFNEKITFQEIETRSNAIGNALLDVGVKGGDRVAVMLRNRSEFPLTWLALAKIGAAMVPINIHYKEFDARYIIEHSGSRVIVTSEEYIPLIKAIQQSHQNLSIIVSVDKIAHTSVHNLSELLESASLKLNPSAVYSETLANIQYTSGTTGHPKGCMLPHSYWLALMEQFTLQPPNINDTDVMLIAQPFYYMDPQWNLLTAIAAGAQLIILDRFHPATFWEKVRFYNVTFFYCLSIMPTLLYKMPLSPHDQDNRVRYVSCSAIPRELHPNLEERWGAPWYETYGLTETGGVTFVLPQDHDRLLGSGSIGKVDKFKEALIVDDNDQPVSRGQTGELILRGIGMMHGYFKDEEANNIAFRSGWFHTGDLIRMDEHGDLYYIGRKKEMIRRGGENVSAAEVEAVLKLYPKVQNAACIAVPDEIRGEEVKAYVVLEPGETKETVAPETLVEFCSKHLAYFKVPRYWEYRLELPLTPSERVAKHLLIKEKDDLRFNSFDHVEKKWR